jgi:ADP-heptose:LPS heptosyltransferase
VREIRARHYDIAIDLRGDLRQILCFLVLGHVRDRVSTDRTGGGVLLTRSWPYDPRLHQVEMNGAIVGLLGVQDRWRLEVPIPSSIPGPIQRRLDAVSGANGFLALALRGNKPNRTWPLAHAASLARRAHEELGLGAVYLGGVGDREYGEDLQRASSTPLANFAGETSLSDLLGIFARAAACVTVDSGPMHLAAASGSPVFALFGPTDPCCYRPWTSLARVITVGAPCGCTDPGCDFGSGPGRCMVRLTPDMVMAALLTRSEGAWLEPHFQPQDTPHPGEARPDTLP